MKKIYRMTEAQFESIIGTKQIYKDGYNANIEKRVDYDKNPYVSGTKEHEQWKNGWMDAESKKQQDHDEETLRAEIGESENVMNEVDEAKNVFSTTVDGVDFYINYNDIFPNMSKTPRNGVERDVVIIDGEAYSPYINVKSAKVRYGIDIEYREFGIKDIYVSPISASFLGEIEMTDANDTYEKEFELEFDTNGIVLNTLSGAMALGGKTIQIPELSKDVKFETEVETENNKSIYVVSVELTLAPNKIIFKY